MEPRTATTPPSRGRNALGRGLRSLIPSPGMLPVEEPSVQGPVLQQLPIEDLLPGDGQPRQSFDDGALKELSVSIGEHGVLQPLVVRRRASGQYEIVAGERRWRASKLAGLKTVPCVISDIADDAMLTVALVENIQREDLNVIEEAESYRRLSEELGLTQEEIAKAVGKDRTTITNALRLLKLPVDTQRLVIERRMSMGHARALLSLKDGDLIQQIADQIAGEGMSVRRTEEIVQRTLADTSRTSTTVKTKAMPQESALEREVRRKMEQALGTKVDLRHQNGQGSLTIHFSSVEQLNEILERFDVTL
jgi:ParB family chromosome partitioning protein